MRRSAPQTPEYGTNLNALSLIGSIRFDGTLCAPVCAWPGRASGFSGGCARLSIGNNRTKLWATLTWRRKHLLSLGPSSTRPHCRDGIHSRGSNRIVHNRVRAVLSFCAGCGEAAPVWSRAISPALLHQPWDCTSPMGCASGSGLLPLSAS